MIQLTKTDAASHVKMIWRENQTCQSVIHIKAKKLDLVQIQTSVYKHSEKIKKYEKW